MKFAFGPKILIDPTFALIYKDFEEKFKGENKISKDSTLILYGRKTHMKDLILDGTLKAAGGEEVKGEFINKEYIKFVPCTDKDPEKFRIRGYKAQHL